MPGFGGSDGSSKEWQVPEQLLTTGKPDERACSSTSNNTVYTLRLSTSWDRGSALSDPMAGVNVCLVGKNGKAVLHRILPVNDPKDHLQMMQDICSSGDEVGADCSILGSMDQAPSWPAGKEPAVKPRFQEGAVDEVSFMAPELGGPLAAIMIAPEGGSWMCDEVDVYSSRSNHTDRFVCRQLLGGRKGEPAAYLKPVPPNAVVYGTGDAAKVISKEQAVVLQELSMSDYKTLKSRLLLTTALLTAGGTGVAAVASGADAAIPFGVGGVAGILYLLLLQLGADAAVAQATSGTSSGMSAAVSSFSAAAARSRGVRVPAGTVVASSMTKPVQEQSFRERMLGVLGSSAFRLLLLTTAAMLAVWALQDSSTETADGASRTLLFHLRPVDAWQLGLGVCGFMMFKVAVLGVSMSAPTTSRLPEPEKHLEKNMQ